MKRQVNFIVLLFLITIWIWPSANAADSTPQAVGPASSSALPGPWVDTEQAAVLLQDYFKRLKLDVTLVPNQELKTFKVNTPIRMVNASHILYAIIDTNRSFVYLYLNRYMMAKPGSPGLSKLLQRLMEENYNLNVGKFEWDKSDGEVRFSYTFTTENGLGYEAFSAIVETLLKTGDRFWPELHGLAEGLTPQQ